MFASQRVNQETQQFANKFKGMRFCEECDNMLDPREFVSGDRHYLQFECKLCSRQ